MNTSYRQTAAAARVHRSAPAGVRWNSTNDKPGSGSGSGPAKPLVVESFSSPTELDKQPLPYLSVALGVRAAPSTAAKGWRERRAEMLDRDVRLAKRQIIAKEVTRGYFHDFHAIRSHGGKTWRAPTTLIRHDRALFFPDIAGTALLDRSPTHSTDLLKGRISLVSILNSRISEEHTKSFSEAVNIDGLQHVQINLQENKLKAYLISLFLSSLRAQVPKEKQNAYIISQQNLDLLREHIGYHNKHVGYTYLVGDDAKIRWAACGFAEPEEKESLVRCAQVLVKRWHETRTSKT